MIRAIAVSILLLIATPAVALEDADYSAAVAATAKNAIIPGYQAFGESAKDMQTRLEALCKAPGDDTLKSAQQQFAALTAAWARIQYISFGPIFEHQRAFRIEYWPDKRNVVGRQLAEVLEEAGSRRPGAGALRDHHGRRAGTAGAGAHAVRRRCAE